MSTVPDVLDALCDGLSADANLASVKVWSAAPGEYIGDNVVLALEIVDATEESLGLGEDDRLETYAIPCQIWVTAPNGDETSIRLARDRAYELFGYVEGYLNDAIPNTLSSTCKDASVEGHSLKQGIYAGSDFNGRWASIDFSVAVIATKAP